MLMKQTFLAAPSLAALLLCIGVVNRMNSGVTELTNMHYRRILTLIYPERQRIYQGIWVHHPYNRRYGNQ